MIQLTHFAKTGGPPELPRFPRLSGKQRSILLKIAVRLRACGCQL